MKKPPGLMIYEDVRNNLLRLPDEMAGRVLKKAILYFDRQEEPGEIPDLPEAIVFDNMKKAIDLNIEGYQRLCEKQRGNANKRWAKEKGPTDWQPEKPDALKEPEPPEEPEDPEARREYYKQALSRRPLD